MTLPLSIGILSWGQHKTLRNTLNSYRRNGLLDKAAQVFIFFQEATPADHALAAQYGLDSIGSYKNEGIAGGYRAMLSYVQQPFYLFLENDWMHLDPYEELEGRNLLLCNYSNDKQLEQGIELLEGYGVDVVRYRNRLHPGNPLWTRQFMGNELSRPEHLLDCAYWIDRPDKHFPQIARQVLGDNDNSWYWTDAAHANWTNNPHMVRTDWAREVLLPHLGERDIELDLQEWWQQQRYIVAQGDGLFTHWRIG